MMSRNEYLYKYNDNNDIYFYEGTNVLINKFGIRDAALLNNAERQITALKIAELEKTPVTGEFDLLHLKKSTNSFLRIYMIGPEKPVKEIS